MVDSVCVRRFQGRKLFEVQCYTSLKQSVELCDHRTFLFVPYYSDIAKKATQRSTLKVVFQIFQGFQIDNLILLDKHFFQTYECQSFGENTKALETDNYRRQMDYERYKALIFETFQSVFNCKRHEVFTSEVFTS